MTSTLRRPSPPSGAGPTAAMAFRIRHHDDHGCCVPTVPDLILIDRRQQSFETPRRPVGSNEGPIVRVQHLRTLGDVSVARGDPELVIRTSLAETDELETRVGIEIDQVAVGWRPGNAREDADATVVAVRHTIDLLLEDGPASDIARQWQGCAAAGRRCERYAVGRKTLIGERPEVTPAAELDLANQIAISLLVVPSILDLSTQERRIANTEVHAIAIPLLGVSGTRSCLVAPKDRASHVNPVAAVPRLNNPTHIPIVRRRPIRSKPPKW